VAERAGHWDDVYVSTPVTEVSWYESRPATSLRLLTDSVPRTAAVVDVGAGASSLVDALVADGWSDVTVLDVSNEALALVRERLGDDDATVSFVVADLLDWQPARRYDAWHDRALFHFLTTTEEQEHYVATAASAVRPDGVVVLGAFAADGPTQCSGLPAARYDAPSLAERFGSAFDLVRSEREEHVTPGGATQPFTWVVLRRR
jgi:SAM-dependent methyltransferase